MMALKNITTNRRAENMGGLFALENPPKRDEVLRDKATRDEVMADIPLEERADLERAKSVDALKATETNIRYNREAIILPRTRIMLSPKYGRRYFDPAAQGELRNSVAQHGILQPILVRPRTSLSHPEITHELVAGYRRMEAAEHNNLPEVPVIARILTDVQAAEIALIENLQRKNPSEVDIGYSLTVLKDEMSAELEKYVSHLVPDAQNVRPPQITERWEQIKGDYEDAPPWFLMVMQRAGKTRRSPKINWADVGQRVGLSSRSIQYLVRIAKLPPDVQEAIQEDKLSGRQAREIAQLNDAMEQRQMASKAIEHGWSGDEIARRVAIVAGRAPEPETGSTPATKLRAIVDRVNAAQLTADFQELYAQMTEMQMNIAAQNALRVEITRWRASLLRQNELLDELERLLEEEAS